MERDDDLTVVPEPQDGEAILSSNMASHLCRVSLGNRFLSFPTVPKEWTLSAFLQEGLNLTAHSPGECSFRVLGH